jgi:Rha family phage regulatory protein
MTDSKEGGNLPQISDEELVFSRDGKVFADSRQVAARFEKRHGDVLRAIDALITEAPGIRRNFASIEYEDSKGRKQPAIEMDRKGFSLLAMRFTGRLALAWQIRYVEAFDHMEAELLRRNRLPFHLRRYALNQPNIPPHHFSVLSEMAVTLIAKLDIAGYELPEKLWPDISEGQYFAKWIREREGFNPLDLGKYTHVFEDGRPSVMANAYPNKYLSDFRYHMEAIWIPQHAQRYFGERDPAALPYLAETCRFLAPPKKRIAPDKSQLDLL